MRTVEVGTEAVARCIQWVKGETILDEIAEARDAVGGQPVELAVGERRIGNGVALFVTFRGPARGGVGEGICVWEVWLDVKDGGAIQQVVGGDGDGASFDSLQLHA